MSAGGTIESMSDLRMKGSEETLRAGGTVSGLVCLTSISNTFSVSGLRFQEQRMEAAGRVFWSTNTGPSAEAPPAGPGMPADGFWEENDPLFPAAWPAKLTLPVVVRDPTKMPAVWQLLAMDEAVVSFWKIVDHCQRTLDAMTKRLQESGVPETEVQALNKKIRTYTEQLEKARKLNRNVVINVEYHEVTKVVEDRALSLREENEALREHCGLTGWNKIAVIGNRRDKLKLAGMECGPDEVAADLSKVKWGAGRAVTGPVAEKAIAIWNRVSSEIVDAILSAQARFGRDSPWEEYTKLTIVIQACKTNADLLWAVETINEEKSSGKRKDNHSNTELKKKSSIVQICQLRKKTVAGMIANYVQAAIEVLESLVAVRPSVKSELDALKTLKQRYNTVSAFHTALANDTKAAGTSAPSTVMQHLPKWCSLKCQRLLRAIMEGRKDGPFSGLCASPPKGGVGSIRFDPDITQTKGFQEELAELKAEFEKWSEERQGKAVAAGQEKEAATGKGQTKEAGEKQKDEQVEETAEIIKVREELAQASKDVRMAHASVQVLPSTKLAITHAIAATAAYKHACNDSTVHRVAFCYMVPCSWDQWRPPQGKQDRRSNLPMALWAEDFDSFVAVAHEMITAENENYAIIFAGRTKRTSAGMASEAGIAMETQLIEAFKKSEKDKAQTWRLKRFTEIMVGKKGRSRGLIGASGSRLEVALLFYRGVWPSKMKGEARSLIPGFTSDDIWMDIPEPDTSEVPKLPYIVKKKHFE